MLSYSNFSEDFWSKDNLNSDEYTEIMIKMMEEFCPPAIWFFQPLDQAFSSFRLVPRRALLSLGTCWAGGGVRMSEPGTQGCWGIAYGRSGQIPGKLMCNDEELTSSFPSISFVD